MTCGVVIAKPVLFLMWCACLKYRWIQNATCVVFFVNDIIIVNYIIIISSSSSSSSIIITIFNTP